MIKIDEFAFCFFSSDITNVVIQESEVTKLSSNYLIERWYRHDRNIGKYVSFSQMVNDAIDDTDSEFMIFCNPKTIFKTKDIEFIIDKLSNGYCFVSVVSFGLFGFSKELIRRIGMLDERFINGEFEDDDFAIRLRHFNKAVWWGYDYDKYDSNWSKSGNLKHITKSIFNQKYEINSDKIIINQDFFTHKKISKRHRKTLQYIYDSWLDNNHNGGNGKVSEYLTKYSTTLVKYNMNETIVDFDFKLDRSREDFRTELLSDNNIDIFILFLSYLDDGRKVLWSEKINSNTWKSIHIPYNNPIEIRLFIDDNQIYNNIIDIETNLSIKFKLPLIIKLIE
jgi:hypothetical protein